MMTLERKRVLVVTRNLPPLVGGMERLNWHMIAELSAVADVRVIAPLGAAELAPTGVTVREVALSPLSKFLVRAAVASVREARAWRPSVILAGSGLTAPIAHLAGRICGARSAVYVHGLDVAVSNRIYRAIWLPTLRHVDRVIANSRATAKLCDGFGVERARLSVVHPGVNILDVAANGMAVQRFREEHELGARPLLVSVGRLTERKGLREFVTRALPRIARGAPDALLLVVGDVPSNALSARAQSRESILSAAVQAGVADNIRFLGLITDFHQLSVVYRSADAHVFPVRDLPGDPEGFGMVAVEAAAHGVPTIAFATGGILDAVSEGRSGRLVEPGSYNDFADAVIDVLARRAQFTTSCRQFAAGFEWSIFGKRMAEELDITR